MNQPEKHRFPFVDSARVFARAGRGGDGCVSFLREKFLAFGGPNGGDGGRGGDAALQADTQKRTLLDLARNPHLTATDGANGRGSNQAGKGGQDCVARVPLGTSVYRRPRAEPSARGGAPLTSSGTAVLGDVSEGESAASPSTSVPRGGAGTWELLADLVQDGQRVVVARGGRGGRGNLSFKTHGRTAPRVAETGEPGEEVVLRLEVRLIADVGLVGFPNAGKSTLLSSISNARPKIADYPFTTLSPQLGVVRHKEAEFVAADIPGLIEGAHEGRGLGDDFLKHLERTRLLLHLVDPLGFGGETPLKGVSVIERELMKFSPALARRPGILVVNKMDLPEGSDVLKSLKSRLRSREVFGISAATSEGVSKLLDAVAARLSKLRSPAAGGAAARGGAPQTSRGTAVLGDVPEGESGASPTVPGGRSAASPRTSAPVGGTFAPRSGGTSVPRSGVEPGALKTAPGRYLLNGEAVERRARMTRWDLREGVERFQDFLKRIGADRRLRQLGIRPGDTVTIAGEDFEWQPEPSPGAPGTGRGRRRPSRR